MTPDLGLLVGIASPIAGFNSATTPATFALNKFMGSQSGTGPAKPTADVSGNLVDYVYTVPTSGAADADGVWPPSVAQVAEGLSNCAMAVADGVGAEYGLDYVTYPSQNPWPSTTVVPGTTGFTNPPNLTVTLSTVSPGGSVSISGSGF
ncbi:MAG: hypothetical protein ABSB99_02240 [Acidimicrobiales bacterium]